MAANRFATMVHRNTNKLVLLLVYAVLEWVLILLLLVNSLFSYFITKFATYVGLQKPCLWCSRVDHILEPGKRAKSYTDLLCESHAAEISQLVYCSNHQKLVESRNMCGSCLASSSGLETTIPSSIDNDKLESDEHALRCCCCSEKYDPYFLFKPSWGSLEYSQKGDLVMEAVDGDENKNGGEFVVGRGQQDQHDEAEIADEHVNSFNSRDTLEEDCLSSSSMFICYEKEAMEDGKVSLLDIMRQGSNASSEFIRQLSDVSLVECHKEDSLTEDIQCSSKIDHMIGDLDHRLIPVELIDFSTRADKGGCSFAEAGDLCCRSSVSSRLNLSAEEKVLGINKSAGKTGDVEPENLKMEIAFVDLSEIGDTKGRKPDLVGNVSERLLSAREIKSLQINVKEAIRTKLNDLAGAASERRLSSDQIILRTSVSAQVSDCANDKDLSSLNNDGPEILCQNASIAQNDIEQGKPSLHDEDQGKIEQPCIHLEPNKQKEDKFPDTPTSIDSLLHHLDKKSLASDKRESGAKESFDGSVVSEMEGVDAVTSVEQLKTALKSERKALSVLYAELEEERSASAIAANQTMAMITRLQEEKAAMQMEALQYQRMMEEQSEYDQEALQLLNDLMIKREKEKQELEKELVVYRKKVLEYEEKEKMRMIRRIRDGSVRSRNSSASCSHAWDSDDLSIDLNRELRDEDSSGYGHQESNNTNNNAPVNAVPNLEEITLECVKHMSILDESLTEFEEERLSILDQLKALEDKLIKLGDEDEEFSKDLRFIANTSQANAEDVEKNLTNTAEENGISDGLLKGNDDPEMRILGSMAKKLLPLLDAADKESEEELMMNEEKAESTYVDMQNSPVSKCELDSNNKVAIEEEVGHVYERLQALEADGEFFKNCISSIKKGDKGVDLLQEILQHLRDLRTIELRMRNANDETVGEVAAN